MTSATPKKGEGFRNIYCPCDSECSTFTAKQRPLWKSWNCDSCPLRDINKDHFLRHPDKEPVDIPPTTPNPIIKKETKIMTTEKVCNKCDTPKPLREFPKNKACKDGHENQCKACKGKTAKTWRDNKKKEKKDTPDPVCLIDVCTTLPDEDCFGLCTFHYDKWEAGEITHPLLGIFKTEPDDIHTNEDENKDIEDEILQENQEEPPGEFQAPNISMMMDKSNDRTDSMAFMFRSLHPFQVFKPTPSCISICFEGYEEIFEILQLKAKEEIRSIENQALYYIIKGMKADGLEAELKGEDDGRD